MSLLGVGKITEKYKGLYRRIQPLLLFLSEILRKVLTYPCMFSLSSGILSLSYIICSKEFFIVS